MVLRLIKAGVEGRPFVEVRGVDTQECLVRQVALGMPEEVQGVLAMQMDMISVLPNAPNTSFQLALCKAAIDCVSARLTEATEHAGDLVDDVSMGSVQKESRRCNLEMHQPHQVALHI